MKIAIAFLVALLVFLGFKLLRAGLRRTMKQYSGFDRVASVLLGLEYLFWMVYIFWAIYWLFHGRFYYPYLIYSVIFIVLGLVSWFLLRDVVAGIIFKLKHRLKPGSHISTVDFSGNIKSLDTTYLKVMTDDGEMLRIPYSRIIHEVIAEVAYSNVLKEHPLVLHLDDTIDLAGCEALIRATIMNTPWSNLKEEPHIKFMETNNEGHLFEVTLFTMSARQVEFIEKSLEQIKGIHVVH